ncbi:MAG: signal recognition particle-docking protein FtsY [Thermoanaerobacterales bacterium]|nr:signal recognition particle-docking protein FtsY [Bacillota bacterium]MDI6907305.1 signal recognition particle-docking protein FtsY [Thermoanaerobacterales bacterium]
MGLFNRLKQTLTKTRQALTEKVEGVVYGRTTVDESFYEELEDVLIQSDVGVSTALELVENLRQAMKERRSDDPTKVRPLLKEQIGALLGGEGPAALNLGGPPPTVIMVVGVNGTGKTTTIGKLAYKLKLDGHKVLLAAADTFRAAAIEQLEVWGRRAGVEVVKHREGADPAAVVYDAVQAAKARKYDVVIVDTAGRLHTKVNLMDELKKVRRVVDRELPDQPQEVLLVLDATTGHNAVNQAEMFGQAVGVTGIVLTKLDGTAKGGIVVAIKRGLGIPVKLVGTGERIEDLAEFDPREFVEALFE